MRIRTAEAALLALLALNACGGGSEHSRIDSSALERLARSLQEAWPVTTDKLQLTISLDHRNGGDVLHCRLMNTSPAALELDSSNWPWQTTQLFQMAAVSSAGRVIHQNPLITQLMAPTHWEAVAAGASVEGDIDTKYLPFNQLPRDQDLMLLWSRGVGLNRGAESVALSGIIFLPKQSPKPLQHAPALVVDTTRKSVAPDAGATPTSSKPVMSVPAAKHLPPGPWELTVCKGSASAGSKCAHLDQTRTLQVSFARGAWVRGSVLFEEIITNDSAQQIGDRGLAIIRSFGQIPAGSADTRGEFFFVDLTTSGHKASVKLSAPSGTNDLGPDVKGLSAVLGQITNVF